MLKFLLMLVVVVAFVASKEVKEDESFDEISNDGVDCEYTNSEFDYFRLKSKFNQL